MLKLPRMKWLLVVDLNFNIKNWKNKINLGKLIRLNYNGFRSKHKFYSK